MTPHTPPAPNKDIDPDLWVVTWKLCNAIRPIKPLEHEWIAQHYGKCLKDAAAHLGMTYAQTADLIVATGKKMIRFGQIRSLHPIAYLIGACSEPAFGDLVKAAPSPEEAVASFAQIVDARAGR